MKLNISDELKCKNKDCDCWEFNRLSNCKITEVLEDCDKWEIESQRSIKKELYEITKAVDAFCLAMKDRLFEKALNGYRGWDGEYCLDRIHGELMNDAEKIDQDHKGRERAVDVANRSMMMWFRFRSDDEVS